MKKRIIVFLLAAIFFNTFAFTSVYAEKNLTEKQQMLLGILNIYDDGMSFDDKLTKAEFAYMVSKAAFRYGTEFLPSYTYAISDVDDGTDYADAIYTLYDAGYLPIDEFGKFNPTKNITANEAAEIIVAVMGYSDVYKDALGGAVKVANDKNIYKNVNNTMNAEITAYDAYNMIYNMLYANISELLENAHGNVKYLTHRVFLYEVSGVVTDDGTNSLTRRSDINKNQIKIGDDIFENKSGRKDLLGYGIGGYYTQENGDDILLAAYVKNTEITEVDAQLIEEFKNREYTYKQDDLSDKTEKTYIPKDAVIIYNGKPLEIKDTFTNDMFIPENGLVKFYDNNNDGNIDILVIESYITGFVSSVDAQNEKIYLDNKVIIDTADKTTDITNEDGEEIAFGDIAKDNTVAYYESSDGKTVKIAVSDKMFVDTVTSFKSDDNVVTFESGAKYTVLKSALKYYGDIEIGTAYSFYADVFGNAAAYKKDLSSNTMQYGCLVKKFADNFIYGVRIYTSADEFKGYEAADKIKVIWEDDTTEKIKPQAFYDKLNYTGIIRYSLNGAGKLSEIEIPHPYGTKPKIDDRLFCMLETISTTENPNATEGYYITVNNNVVNYGGEAIINSGTTVYKIPKNDPDDRETYDVLSCSTFTQGSSHEIRAYGVDYKSKIATATAIYAENGSGVIGDKITNEWPSVLYEIKKVYNEEKCEELYELKVSDVLGNITAAYMEEEVYNNVFSIGAGDTSAKELKPGDIFFYATSGEYITNALLAYDMDLVVKDEKGNDLKGAVAGTELSYYSAANTLCNPFATTVYEPGQAGNVNSWKYTSVDVRIFSGWVYSYENGYIQITNQNPAYGYSYDKTKDDGSVTQIFNYGRRVNVNVSDSGKVLKVGPATDADIRPYLEYGADCTRVVITVRAYEPRSLTFYN